MITNFFQKPLNNNNFLNSLYQETKIFFKNNLNLIQTKSDKGNITVIMNKVEYLVKMFNQLFVKVISSGYNLT